jgi:ketosteroid isomerase-like protein
MTTGGEGMTVEDEVRQASDQFYAALGQMLSTGDPGPVTALWSQGQHGSTMHPIGGREVGRDQILATWEQAGPVFSEGRVTVDDLVVIPLTENVAYTISTERFEGKVGGEPVRGEWRATNIYHREDGGWKIVHHHADASPELQELLRRLQSQGGQGGQATG